MFNSEELSVINLDYFNVISCMSDVCELESQNGDHWIVLKKQVRTSKKQISGTNSFENTFVLYHRHFRAEGFHFHAEYISALEAVLDIINHDDFRLKRVGKTFFDDVVLMFS